MTPNINAEIKQCSVAVTNEGWVGVQGLAAKLNLSVSELLEQVGRGQLVVCEPPLQIRDSDRPNRP